MVPSYLKALGQIQKLQILIQGTCFIPLSQTPHIKRNAQISGDFFWGVGKIWRPWRRKKIRWTMDIWIRRFIFGSANPYLDPEIHSWTSKSIIGSANPHSFLTVWSRWWTMNIWTLGTVIVIMQLDILVTTHILSIDLQMAQLWGRAKKICHIDTMNCTQVTLQVSAALVMIVMRSQGLTTTTSGRLLRFSYLPFW